MFPILLPVGVLSQDSNLSHRKLELGKPLQKDTLAPMVSSACLVKKSIMKMLVQLAQFARSSKTHRYDCLQTWCILRMLEIKTVSW